MAFQTEDFSADAAATPPTGAKPGTPAAPAVKVYDPNPDRENIRGQIALWLLWFLGAIMAALLTLLVFRVINVDEVLKLVGVLLTPIVGLFGAVMGFYFGEKSALAGASTTPAPPPQP